MSISKIKTKPADAPAAKPEAAVDAFIAGAMERPRGVVKGNKQQISITISPALLDRLDAMAARLGQSRAGLISVAITAMVEKGVTFE